MCSPTKRKREKGWEKDNARDAAAQLERERRNINVRSLTRGKRTSETGARGRAETRGGVWSTEAVRN